MDSVRDPSIDLVTHEAITWFMYHRENDLAPEVRARFAQWLAASPLNVAEYLAVTQTLGSMSVVDAWPEQSTQELVAIARATANVVSFPNAMANVPNTRRSSRGVPQRRWLWGGALSCALVLSAIGYLVSPADWFAGRQFSTSRGEQRSLVLSDGSVVQLNTLTHVTIRFETGARRIELATGEAFFRVAHDPRRPFEVVTATAVVRAVGTQFNVYTGKEGTRVAVVEGSVNVAPTSADSHATSVSLPDSTGRAVHTPNVVALGPEDALDVDPAGEATRAPPVQSSRATAWIQRRLMFDDERLDRVVEEFNRYNTRQMQVVDPKLATLRITGVFNADDPNALVKYLARVQSVTAVPDSRGSVLLRRSGATLEEGFR